ncbi:MAG TPA: DUF3597 domain-containing protein [Chthoniobacterales bacterium]
MGMFNDLMAKIFKHTDSPAGQTPGTGVTAPGATPATAPPVPTAGAAVTSVEQATPPPAATFDVAAVLDGLAAKNPEHLDWKRSIVDLLKLVGMDSGLAARKTLAAELHYSGDTGDSAAMNLWLHKEVLKQLAQNGGTLPPGLLGT